MAATVRKELFHKIRKHNLKFIWNVQWILLAFCGPLFTITQKEMKSSEVKKNGENKSRLFYRR